MTKAIFLHIALPLPTFCIFLFAGLCSWLFLPLSFARSVSLTPSSDADSPRQERILINKDHTVES
ncbi:hypothetical protein BDV36DRAFT_248811 [Aspergillus pseudocaelatus]|uniref:Uncharacterized protein n=1 Tax=Aspergillus pseudocaelatus TaxID=1825620 RepID=A0ABQ6WUW4_9EURO|nr:hypothetical protein BDV36DRAFT_248811 [Aspergillus pseudocaelatus]